MNDREFYIEKITECLRQISDISILRILYSTVIRLVDDEV